MTITPTPLPDRPASPWTGSRYETRHQWQLDGVRTLDEAVVQLRGLADELDAADAAGWWLTEPVRSGHLLAERASRRRRRQPTPQDATCPNSSADPRATAAPVLPPWRARVVDEPPQHGAAVLRLAEAAATPVVTLVAGTLTPVGGPPLSASLRTGLARQDVTGLAGRRWGVAPARVGPAADLVADGSALLVHAVESGVLVRSVEVLAFLHGADGAATLPSAASAYRRLASAAEAMLLAGGRLSCVDDGFLQITYGRP